MIFISLSVVNLARKLLARIVAGSMAYNGSGLAVSSGINPQMFNEIQKLNDR